MKNLNNENFNNNVLKNNRLTLVDFYATWCPPCKMLTPILEKISTSRADFDVMKLNVDEAKDLAKHYQVNSVPTMILFKDGQQIDRLIGFNDENKILETIEKHAEE